MTAFVIGLVLFLCWELIQDQVAINNKSQKKNVLIRIGACRPLGHTLVDNTPGLVLLISSKLGFTIIENQIK